jgi:hypothetical protein
MQRIRDKRRADREFQDRLLKREFKVKKETQREKRARHKIICQDLGIKFLPIGEVKRRREAVKKKVRSDWCTFYGRCFGPAGDCICATCKQKASLGTI